MGKKKTKTAATRKPTRKDRLTVQAKALGIKVSAKMTTAQIEQAIALKNKGELAQAERDAGGPVAIATKSIREGKHPAIDDPKKAARAAKAAARAADPEHADRLADNYASGVYRRA